MVGWHDGMVAWQDVWQHCNADPLCTALHDYDCDGAGWRYCKSALEVRVSAFPGTQACTLVAEHLPLTTALTTPAHTAPAGRATSNRYTAGRHIYDASYYFGCDDMCAGSFAQEITTRDGRCYGYSNAVPMGRPGGIR